MKRGNISQLTTKHFDSPLFWSLWPLPSSLVARCHMKRFFPTNCSLVTDYWQRTQLYHRWSLTFPIGHHHEDQAPPDHLWRLLTDLNSWTQHEHQCEHHLSVCTYEPYNMQYDFPKRMGRNENNYGSLTPVYQARPHLQTYIALPPSPTPFFPYHRSSLWSPLLLPPNSHTVLNNN